MLRPSDVKVAHNKIVAQCRAVTDSSTLPLPEIIKQIEGIAKSAGTVFEEMCVGLGPHKLLPRIE